MSKDWPYHDDYWPGVNFRAAGWIVIAIAAAGLGYAALSLSGETVSSTSLIGAWWALYVGAAALPLGLLLLGVGHIIMEVHRAAHGLSSSHRDPSLTAVTTDPPAA